MYFVDPGLLIVADGAGCRKIRSIEAAEEQTKSSADSCKQDIFDLLSETLAWDPPHTQKPVLLLADSMGRCIPITDSVIEPVVKIDYRFDQMAADIMADIVQVQHKHVIIWSGSKTLDLKMDRILKDLKQLINVIQARSNAMVHVSSVIPQPRDHHKSQGKIAQFNSQLKSVVQQFQDVTPKVGFINSHLIYLDQNLDIIRPIVDNFEDGFHLNLHGAHRLRQQWLAYLGIKK